MAVSNTGMVLFVLGIIYLILFFMALTNTGKKLFKCCNTKSSTPLKVFVCFYGCILVQIILSDALYWVYFAEIKKLDAIPDELARIISLVFLPTILMIISYCLMFFQLEQIIKRSRIQSG